MAMIRRELKKSIVAEQKRAGRDKLMQWSHVQSLRLQRIYKESSKSTKLANILNDKGHKERRRISARRSILRKEDSKEHKQLYLFSRWFNKIKFSSWLGAFMELAAELAMETSKVKTVVRNEARKIPAGSLYIQTQERSDVVEEEIQSQATVHQQMIFGDRDSKTMSFT
ncbi:hypothetical protein F511_18425 [Dorcoceras hygrometricum]|uniref:Uncharacterized protein n=1 Tax=Dorcoceras hygrometricum TaxID=472368 RepID=A0A2Z7C6H6_9LAMI|nr:hypothetical protein F511_18425 [Dorcoceras hygrometricum]